jgi:hypothetical protein
MDCSTNSQLPHAPRSSGASRSKLVKHGSADQLLPASMTNKFKVFYDSFLKFFLICKVKKRDPIYSASISARHKDNVNSVPKLEDCLISFSITETDSDVEEEEEEAPPGSPTISSLDYLRRPYARYSHLQTSFDKSELVDFQMSHGQAHFQGNQTDHQERAFPVENTIFYCLIIQMMILPVHSKEVLTQKT